MRVPKIFEQIILMFDPDIFKGSVNFVEEFKNYFYNKNLKNKEIDEFVNFINEITDERHTDIYCQELFESTANTYTTEPGNFRNLLRYIRDIILTLRR